MLGRSPSRVPMKQSTQDPVYRRFLQALIDARHRSGVTQVQLATRLMRDQVFVSKCERGHRRLSIEEALVWCQALGVPLTDVVSEFESAVRAAEGMETGFPAKAENPDLDGVSH